MSQAKTGIYIHGTTDIPGKPLTWNRETKTDKQEEKKKDLGKHKIQGTQGKTKT